jgi:hypothetical protein
MHRKKNGNTLGTSFDSVKPHDFLFPTSVIVLSPIISTNVYKLNLLKHKLKKLNINFYWRLNLENFDTVDACLGNIFYTLQILHIFQLS